LRRRFPATRGTIAAGPPERGFQYHELAQIAYGVQTPTASQLSSVRRIVAKLVKRGQATRSERGFHEGNGAHVRHVRRIVHHSRDDRGEFTIYERVAVWHDNPSGTLICSPQVQGPLTREQTEAKAAFLGEAAAIDRALSA
jgi:hypothetical protein